MMITAVYPIIDVAFWGGLLYLKRARDQKRWYPS